MKIIILAFILSASAWSKDYVLSDASASYTVKHIFKTVKGESKELKGKMVCDKGQCEYLVAIPVKSFTSSDSNRDLNMLTILESEKYPLVTVKGTLPEEEMKKSSYQFKGAVLFHGIEKEYLIKVQGGQRPLGQFIVLLEQHKVERPSLLTAKIDNEVPIDFNFNWK